MTVILTVKFERSMYRPLSQLTVDLPSLAPAHATSSFGGHSNRTVDKFLGI